MQASGRTATAAEHALKLKFPALVQVWLEDLDLEGRVGESTRELYERDMRTLVLPAFEHFTLREITISKVDRFLKAQAKCWPSGNATSR